jgi:DNA invertase Pin-like site-specific DNA recombinase
MQVVGYVRVSTAGQGESGAGLEAQRAAIVAACETRRWTLVGIEEDVASGNSQKRRPGLDHALELCDGGQADGLIVAKLDRLSRSTVDFGKLLERAQRKGWKLNALDFNLDTSTPTGEMVANVIVAMAQYERRVIGERTKTALAVKRKQGVRLGRRPTLPAVVRRRIARERARGLTYRAIAERLNADGVPTAQGGREWYPATVRTVLVGATR